MVYRAGHPYDVDMNPGDGMGSVIAFVLVAAMVLWSAF